MKWNSIYFYLNFLVVFYCIPSLLMYFITETPFDYYAKKDLEGLKNCLHYILKINYKGDELEKRQELLNNKLQSKIFKIDETSTQCTDEENNIVEIKKESIFTKILSKKNIIYLIIVIFQACSTQTIYGETIFLNKSLGINNVFISGMVLSLFEIIGYIFMFLLANRYNRKPILFLFYGIIFISSLLVFLMSLILKIFMPYEERNSAFKFFEVGKFIIS